MADRFYVATRKGLFEIARRGAGEWSVDRASFVGDNVNLVMRDRRDGAMYVALDHGHFGPKMQRSRDGGATWTEIAAPAFPPRPEDVPEVKDNWGKPIPWTTKLVWALAPGHPDEPGVLWAGTIPGGLFKSSDGGDSWELNRPLWDMPERARWFGGGADLPGIHSICVDPRSARQVAVGVSCGGVWTSGDGGATWTCRAEGMRAAYMPPEQAYDPVIQDPHMMVQSPTRPDVMYVQHHNGIFKTENGAASWKEIEKVEPSVFGFAVAVHPRDPDTAWFVPAIKDEKRIPVEGRVVVTRTRDGGKSFEMLRSGLPQTHAYDLVFRHALDVDDSGARLAFGSTTGSVWVTEDAGDSWHLVTAHLPPVYAVRF